MCRLTKIKKCVPLLENRMTKYISANVARLLCPENGGYGQWTPGMTQIGDMFNYELRDRVERLCQELNDPSHGEHEPRLVSFSEGPAALTKQSTMKPMKPMAQSGVIDRMYFGAKLLHDGSDMQRIQGDHRLCPLKVYPHGCLRG